MPLKFPKVLKPGDPVAEFFQSLLRNPLVDGELFEGVVFEANETVAVRHRLGRPARGVICVKSTVDVSFKQDDSSNTRPSSEVLLINPSGSAQTASFWIF